MILERIDVHEFGAHPIGHAEPIAGRTVVVAGRESLNVEPPDPACRQNDDLAATTTWRWLSRSLNMAPVQAPFRRSVSSTAAQNSSN